MQITYIGHATLLIRIGRATILTDPNFDPQLGRFLKRVAAPGIAMDALPPLDAMLLTHAHADHLSFDSLRALPDVPVLAPPSVAAWVKKRGVKRAEGVAPDETRTIRDTMVHVGRATHTGARYGFDRWRADANMYLLDTKSASVFFAGDTALTDDTTRLVERALDGRRLDVALLPIGYAPPWKRRGFRRGHLTTHDALELFARLGARHFVPYHWGTFNHVTASAFDAIEELRTLLPGHARGADVRILEPGETLTLDHATPAE